MNRIFVVALAFCAGVACAATVAAFNYKEPLPPADFLERSNVLLAEVADIGAHVAGVRDGRVFLRAAPPIACIPIPKPNIGGGVPIAQLRAGLAALQAVNEGLIEGEKELATLVDKCHIVGE